MTYDELKGVIEKMTPEQRKTEVCVFDDSHDGWYSWIARVRNKRAKRPILVGVRDKGQVK